MSKLKSSNETKNINKTELVNQSIDYMIQHMSDELTVKEVADYFHYSEFYFSRVFKSVTGDSVYAYLKQLKMNQSAIDIKLKRDKSITEIGLDYGYTASNYSSVFKTQHKITPSEFRKKIDCYQMKSPFGTENIEIFKSFSEYHNHMTIETLPDYDVIYERVFGTYYDLKDKWMEFLEEYKEHIKNNTILIERFFDDPTITDPNHCVCDLCATFIECGTFTNRTVLKGGKFAVYRYEGKIDAIFGTVQGIFSVWLPSSGFEMDERFGLHIYRSIDIESQFVVMDLCIPIK